MPLSGRAKSHYEIRMCRLRNFRNQGINLELRVLTLQRSNQISPDAGGRNAGAKFILVERAIASASTSCLHNLNWQQIVTASSTCRLNSFSCQASSQ
jgi:hypothetical protein